MMSLQPPKSDDDLELWNRYAIECRDLIRTDLENWIVERFRYSPRFIRQHLGGLGNTLCIRVKKFDIYIRLFAASHNGWPRDNLVIARIGFQKTRSGHGRSLVQLFTKLARDYGYRTIYIESVNEDSAAFAKRLGFAPDSDGRNWSANTTTLQKTAFN